MHPTRVAIPLLFLMVFFDRPALAQTPTFSRIDTIAHWYARASGSTSASLPCAPTNCTPIGKRCPCQKLH